MVPDLANLALTRYSCEKIIGGRNHFNDFQAAFNSAKMSWLYTNKAHVLSRIASKRGKTAKVHHDQEELLQAVRY